LARNFPIIAESHRPETIVFAPRKPWGEAGKKLELVILISCTEVRRELSNYLENDVTAELRARIEQHVLSCTGCKAVYDGMRNVLRLVTASEIIELPKGFSLRLYRRLMVAG
jgi:Putative zinc-finger